MAVGPLFALAGQVWGEGGEECGGFFTPPAVAVSRGSGLMLDDILELGK